MSKYRVLAEDEFPAYCARHRAFYLNLILKNPDGHCGKIFTDPDGRACKRNDPRTLLDSWFAHWSGPLYLRRTGSVQWFNHREMSVPRLREAVKSMHFISKEAWNVLAGRMDWQRLMKDHAVPIKVLRREIKEKNFSLIYDLEQFLVGRYRLGVITYAENGRLRGDLRDELPDNDRSEYARYSDARVKIERSMEHLDWLRNREQKWLPKTLCP